MARALANNMDKRKYSLALVAISLGTILEWYDFTVYTQMSAAISKAFFPSSNPAVQALSLWGVFAIGYVSRPVGAIAFGHLGDTRGRGLCLLVSVILMGVPTVIIGCLPTYAQAGIAAPALLAVMRLIQGLAMGGEFGAAMVYLHEIATPEYKTLTGSLGYVSLGIGVVIGILVVAAVLYTVPADAMLVWGWRVPFLAAVVTLAIAIMMRYNMPESEEFLESRDEIEEEYERRQRMIKAKKSGANTDLDVDVAASLDDTKVNLQDAAVAKAVDPADPEAQRKQHITTQHYTPVLELFRGHWMGIIVQTTYEAWLAAGFYLGYSWLPSFFVKTAGFPTTTTLWMTLSAMVLYTLVVPVASWVSDKKGVGRVTATMAVTVVACATSIPFFLGFATKSLAVCWVLQVATMLMAAYTMSLLPAICSNIYPAGVRISGFNLAYNLGMTLFGGLTPLIMTSIQTNTGSLYLGPGIWMTCMAATTVLSCVVLLKRYPATNK